MELCFWRDFSEVSLSFSMWLVSLSNILLSCSLMVRTPCLRISFSLASVYNRRLATASSPIDCLYSSMVSLLPKMSLTFSGALPLKNRITGSSLTVSLFNASSLSELSFASSFFLTSSMSSANAPIRSAMLCLLSFIFFSSLVYVCPFRCHSRPSRFRFFHLRRRMTPWLGAVARTTP